MQYRGSSCIKPVAHICFYFFACKSYNAEAAMLIVGVLVAGAFLLNTFPAIFAFLIVKIAMQGQQLCYISQTYLFSLFCL